MLDNVMGHTFGGFFCGTITAVFSVVLVIKKLGVTTKQKSS
jgi:hypothetical protein